MKHDSQILSSDNNNLRDDQFALIILDKQSSIRLFPVEDKQSTIDSCMEYDKYIDDLGPNEQLVAAKFLKAACGTWNIIPPISVDNSKNIDYPHNKIAAEVPLSIPKMASAEHYVHYALKGKYYAIDDSRMVKQACEYFEGNSNGFGMADRRSFAQNVSRRSTELGCDSSQLIEKFASEDYSESLMPQLEIRRYLSSRPLKQDYEKLASYAGDIPVDQFVSLLEGLDKKTGLSRLYASKRLLDPLTATVGHHKQASAWTVTINGTEYGPEKLASAIKHPDVRKLYGEGMVDQLEKFPEIFTSLPMTDQEDIMSYAD